MYILSISQNNKFFLLPKIVLKTNLSSYTETIYTSLTSQNKNGNSKAINNRLTIKYMKLYSLKNPINPKVITNKPSSASTKKNIHLNFEDINLKDKLKNLRQQKRRISKKQKQRNCCCLYKNSQT